ncbi:MAG: septal ring lytic transglycosylase RlpA family protein [Spirochaetes bacterium]|nr:septal ring lytic transglycosylase RlpA family protein [Spirochaetota bacterium]
MRSASRWMAPGAGILALLFFASCAAENSFVKTRDYRTGEYGAAANSSGYEEESAHFSDAENGADRVSTDAVTRGNEAYDSHTAGDSLYKKESYFQTGLASWYGREFNGKRTASGERFDMNGLTAAHKTLPFGTVLKVKNFDNGKIVTVRINDRGPYRGNRILDLSYGAARKIGMLQPGQAQVGIQILRKGGEVQPYERDYEDANDGDVEAVSDGSGYDNASGGGSYAIQAGAFYSKHNADSLKSRIEGMTTNSVVIKQEGDMYKVRIEGLYSQKDVERMKQALSEENIPSYIIQKEE